MAGWILELDRGKGLPFEGNYSEWLARRAARRQSEARTSANLARALDAELEFMRSNAKGQAKKGRARERKYEDLVSAAADAARSADTLDAIAIPTGPRLGDVVVEVADLCKSHGGRALLDGVSFSVPPGAVVGIVGANGVGKSTLFRMIMGQEEPDSGTIKVGETVVPMYVDQSRDALDADATVAEAIGRGAEVLSIAGRDVPVRQYASFFNFKGADQQKKVRTRGRGGAHGSEPPTRGRPADPPPPASPQVGVLSGGERNRLHLAITLATAGNLLLLDEPTNDLDVFTLAALESAIDAFPGSALIISHDRAFLDRLCTHTLAYEDDGGVVFFDGGYSAYEADWRARNGGKDPTRVKYRKMAAA